MIRKKRETPWQIAERERLKVARMVRLAGNHDREMYETGKRRRQEEADMTQEQRASQWEPTREEIWAALRACNGWITRAEAEAIVTAVAPGIAARALREAATEWEHRGYVRGESANRWLESRASSLSPDPNGFRESHSPPLSGQ